MLHPTRLFDIIAQINLPDAGKGEPDMPANNNNGSTFFRRQVAPALLIAILISAWNLKNSFEFGRLTQVPTFDDVSYFADAVFRYHSFLKRSVWAILYDFVTNTPHSPILTIQALISYMIFGVQDWAPYITNIWVPIFVFSLILTYCKDIGQYRWVIVFYVATLPMMGLAITEFRPDIGNGVIAAACAAVSVYAITSESAIVLTRLVACSGVLFALALLTKPSAALYSIGVVGISCVASVIGQLLCQREQFSTGILKSMAILFLGVCLALPYYIVDAAGVLEYSWNAVVRDKAIWADAAKGLGSADYLYFYLTGIGGQFMLHLHVLPALLSIPLLFLFFRKVAAVQRLRLCAILFSLPVIYAVISASPVKSGFFGVAFQALLVLFSVLVLVELYKAIESRFNRVLLSSFLLIVSLLSIQPSGYFGMYNTPSNIDVRQTADKVREVIQFATSEDDPQSHVLVLFVGPLSAETLTYELFKHGVSNVRVGTYFFRPAEDDPVEVCKRRINEAHFVVAASEGARIAQLKMPVNQILPLTLSLVQNDPAFTHLQSIPSGQGSVEVFVRNKP